MTETSSPQEAKTRTVAATTPNTDCLSCATCDDTAACSPELAQAATLALHAIMHPNKRQKAFKDLSDAKKAAFARDKVAPILDAISDCVGLHELGENWDLQKLSGVRHGVKTYDRRQAMLHAQSTSCAIMDYRSKEEKRLQQNAALTHYGLGVSLSKMQDLALPRGTEADNECAHPYDAAKIKYYGQCLLLTIEKMLVLDVAQAAANTPVHTARRPILSSAQRNLEDQRQLHTPMCDAPLDQRCKEGPAREQFERVMQSLSERWLLRIMPDFLMMEVEHLYKWLERCGAPEYCSDRCEVIPCCEGCGRPSLLPCACSAPLA